MIFLFRFFYTLCANKKFAITHLVYASNKWIVCPCRTFGRWHPVPETSINNNIIQNHILLFCSDSSRYSVPSHFLHLFAAIHTQRGTVSCTKGEIQWNDFIFLVFVFGLLWICSLILKLRVRQMTVAIASMEMGFRRMSGNEIEWKFMCAFISRIHFIVMLFVNQMTFQMSQMSSRVRRGNEMQGQIILQRMGYNQSTGHLHLMTQNPQWICLTLLSICVCTKALPLATRTTTKSARKLVNWLVHCPRKKNIFVCLSWTHSNSINTYQVTKHCMRHWTYMAVGEAKPLGIGMAKRLEQPLYRFIKYLFECGAS